MTSTSDRSWVARALVGLGRGVLHVLRVAGLMVQAIGSGGRAGIAKASDPPAERPEEFRP